jgi:hypothetical protein
MPITNSGLIIAYTQAETKTIIMKKTKFFSLLAALVVGVIACNDDADSTTSTTDTSSTTMETNSSTMEANTPSTTNTNTSDYAALADTFRMNSEAGNYLDTRTGKSIKIGVDPQTGMRYNTQTEEPVWRYVDKRTWWVYGGENWDTIGQARMDNNKLMYEDEGDKWVTYENRWKTEDEKMMTDWKTKNGGTKIKISKDGDIKVKDASGKVKYDGDDNKMKKDSSH